MSAIKTSALRDQGERLGNEVKRRRLHAVVLLERLDARREAVATSRAMSTTVACCTRQPRCPSPRATCKPMSVAQKLLPHFRQYRDDD